QRVDLWALGRDHSTHDCPSPGLDRHDRGPIPPPSPNCRAMTNHGSTLYRHDRRRISYAQNCGDILIDRLFQGEVCNFIVIGACHPILDSNTWFFYERGWRGVNLEPSSSSFGLFLDQRPEDLNLNLAASDFDGELTLYEVNDHVINGTSTLAAEVAQDYLQR